MPPPIPDRYRLEIRLGRDHDIEEWLGTDLNLDRPVLIRILGPEADAKRRAEFLAVVRAAAAINHPHLEPIYAAEEVLDGAFSVSEWGGGLTLQSRLDSGQTLDPAEFLANASGLASALAAIHEAGLVHGAIDAGSILYTVSRPARLGGFGRPRRYLVAPTLDVSDLAAVLEQSLTGLPPGGPPPSEMIDGLPSAVDRALRRALSGNHDARNLATELDGIQQPFPPPLADVSSGRRGPVLAMTLVLLAIILIVIGRLLAGDQLPVVPDASTTLSGGTSSSATSDAPIDPVGVGVLTFDPFGEGGENDDLIELILDGDVATAWRTERYRDPMESIKPGVGLTVSVRGTPTSVEIVGLTAGVDLSIAWSSGRPETPSEWENLAAARSTDLEVLLQLPPRTDGNWLIWFTSLPQQSDGNYWTSVSEIRFRP
jgi:serine/threonine protein kinase